MHTCTSVLIIRLFAGFHSLHELYNRIRLAHTARSVFCEHKLTNGSTHFSHKTTHHIKRNYSTFKTIRKKKTSYINKFDNYYLNLYKI